MIGTRIQERLDTLGLSQSELARRTSLNQSTINGLVRGHQRSSVHLHRIARALETSPAYLSGEIDDPAADAAPPAPLIQHVLMPVALPSENALAQMFEGLLELVDRSAPMDELARELAQLLPTGLLQLRGRLTELAPLLPLSPKAAAPALASEDREPPR